MEDPLPAQDRPSSFLFHARDWLVDTRRLTDRQGRRYIDGMAASWSNGSYGVGTVSDWKHWMGYDGTEDEWDYDIAALQRLFLRGACPELGEIWIQKRMALTRSEQVSYFKTQAENGKRGAEVRWHRHSDGMATGMAKHSVVEVEVDLENLKTKTKTRPRAKRSVSEVHGFAEFYAAYPRKEDRIDATRAFNNALQRHRNITADEIGWAASEFAKDYAKSGRDRQFIKLPATWLNKGSYLEYLEDKPSGQEAT